MGLFHKDNRIGICEWCDTPGIPLRWYDDMLVCDGCHPELHDKRDSAIERVEEKYQELLDMFDRTGG